MVCMHVLVVCVRGGYPLGKAIISDAFIGKEMKYPVFISIQVFKGPFYHLLKSQHSPGECNNAIFMIMEGLCNLSLLQAGVRWRVSKKQLCPMYISNACVVYGTLPVVLALLYY